MVQSQTAGPSLALIVAAARNGVIGRDNRLPWRLPGELQYFKAKTWGKPVIMGRRTHESIGRALPGRLNIVVSRRCQPRDEADVCWVNNLEAAINRARERCPESEEIMVMGGEALYRLALSRADRIYLTRIDAQPAGDAWFPSLDSDEWQLIDERAGPEDATLPHRFQYYERVKA